MIAVFIRFLTLNVVSTHPAVLWGLGFVWVVLLVASISSLRVQDLSTAKKVAWFLLILLVPIAGLAVYCLFCLARGNWSFLKTLLAQPRVIKAVKK